MEENFKALKELIDDPKYDAALPTLKDAANKLRGKVKDYRNFKMKSNTIPVTGSPAARELGGKEPESKEEKVSEKKRRSRSAIRCWQEPGVSSRKKMSL